MREEKVLLKLSKAEALVLFEFLARFSKDESLSIEDQAEQRVLWDVECRLERALAEPLMSNYDEFLAAARNQVRDTE